MDLVLANKIENKIYLIRGLKVMLDFDLAELYGVKTKRLKEQVKRNSERFPKDFMFELSNIELDNWRSQFATSNSGMKMGLRHKPYAFTQEGVAMLSSVLNSERAIQVNIAIMRVFVHIRELIKSHEKIWQEIINMKKSNKTTFQLIFEAIRKLQYIEVKPKRIIGFARKDED